MEKLVLLLLTGLSLLLVFSVVLTYITVKRSADRKIKAYRTIDIAIEESGKIKEELEHKIYELNKETKESKERNNEAKDDLERITAELKNEKTSLSRLKEESKEVLKLKDRSEFLSDQIYKRNKELTDISSKVKSTENELLIKDRDLHDLMGKIDLYSRLDEFVDNGHFEVPDYLYETSARFAEEIKKIRNKQKQLIKDKDAVTYPDEVVISDDQSLNNNILNGQVKLMLSAFNIECDDLIGKVNPSSFSRTLERIEKLANTLEKSAASLHCGFNIKYVELKFEECRLQYQFTLKKQEEQEEQRLIREQIREEQRAIKEYEQAVSKAEKEERMYRNMLDKARKELQAASEEERIIAELRISELERQLAEAEETEKRAKSMAEQTKKGHVYVISNIGSFGEGIYKIGLTRRLEPMDRVKELGGASVPFSFDVHAMVYVEDAPALEAALHREFSSYRVNAVNFRKEFFRTSLDSIKNAVERIAGKETEFKTTVAAEEYYESRRLQRNVA